MVYRPGQPARPQNIPDQYNVYVTLPPMRSIKNEKFKADICQKTTMAVVPAIEALIQSEGLAGKIVLHTSMANMGGLVLENCPQDFADKVKALPGIKLVEPAPAYYPAQRPGPGLRGGPQ